MCGASSHRGGEADAAKRAPLTPEEHGHRTDRAPALDVGVVRASAVDQPQSIPAGHVAASGRMAERARDHRPEGGYPREKCRDGAGTGPWEEEAILVLFALGCHLAAGEDQRRGVRGGEWRVRERGGAEGMVEDRGGARPPESQSVGQEGGRRGAVTVEGMLHGLEVVFAMSPGAVEVCIHPRGLAPAAMPSACTRTRQGCAQDAAAAAHSADTRLLRGGRAPCAWAWAVRCWESPRAAGMLGAACRSTTAWPAPPQTNAIPRRWASTSPTSGVAQWLSPRTRRGGWGPCRRSPARRRTKLRAFARPGGRVPGRRQAVPTACEGPSTMPSGPEPELREWW